MQKPCISGFSCSHVGSKSNNSDWLVKLWPNDVRFLDPCHTVCYCIFLQGLKPGFLLSLGMFCEKSELVC